MTSKDPLKNHSPTGEWLCLNKARDALTAGLGEGNCDTSHVVELVAISGDGVTHTQTIDTGVNGNDDGITDLRIGGIGMPQALSVGFSHPLGSAGLPVCLFLLDIFDEVCQLPVGQTVEGEVVGIVRVGVVHVCYFLSFHLLYQHYIMRMWFCQEP